MSVPGGVAGLTVCCDGRAGVEAEPADPEKRSADEGEEDVVGIESVFAEAFARSNHDSGHQTRHAGRDVHDVSSSEVHDAALVHETINVPAGVSDGTVDGHVPDGYKVFRFSCNWGFKTYR